MFFISLFCFSFKNNRRTNVVLVNIFENALKKVNNRQKRPKWRFWQLIAFLVHFQKYHNQKDICASIVFKAESKPKHEEQFFGGFYFKNQKHAFSGVQNSSF